MITVNKNTNTNENVAQNEVRKKSKLLSSKLWVTIWAVAMVSFIVIADRANFLSIANWLCAVPLAYIGCNVWQKQIYKDGLSK